mmetsp:Transcript_37032/g.61327  ORF Transcript_37032/g.61327 Transcript_37032/m.61327 type:complete len:178 (-) Transcript_37032:13-546(-)
MTSNQGGEQVPIEKLVGGLHGGKYQFSVPSACYEFADALASSSTASTTSTSMLSAAGHCDVPRWASALKPTPEQLSGELRLDACGTTASVHVDNAMMTWEPFFAKVLPAVEGLEVQPAAGILAPRGGANNACDPSKPYSDSQHFEIRWDGKTSCNVFLVVGTEEEQWTFSITAEATL